MTDPTYEAESPRYPEVAERDARFVGHEPKDETMTDDPKCEAGCISYYGGEKKHHKDCPYYPESLTKLNADRIEALLAERDALEAELAEAEARGYAQAVEDAARVAGPKKKSAKIKGGGWFKDTYRDKGSVTAIQVRQRIAENIRALSPTPTDPVAEAARVILSGGMTNIATIVLNAVESERTKWEESQAVRQGQVPQETITLAMFEACLRALAQKEGE